MTANRADAILKPRCLLALPGEADVRGTRQAGAEDGGKHGRHHLRWQRERISRFQGVVFSVFVPGGAIV